MADAVGLSGGSEGDCVPGVACPDASGVGVPVGVLVGDGVLVSLELGDGDGDGDGDGEVDGDPVGEVVGDVGELADDFPGPVPGLQLADVVGAVEPDWPPVRPPYGLPLCEWCEEDELLLELPPGTPVSLTLLVYAGSAVMAQEAPRTTSSPVAIAATGRIQPPQRPEVSSGPLNCSTNPTHAYLILTAIGPRYVAAKLSAQRTPAKYLLPQSGSQLRRAGRPTGGPAAIFVRIRSSPSAAGSIESAASRSARLSVSSAVA